MTRLQTLYAYRLFFLRADGRVTGVPDPIEAIDDESAVRLAEEKAGDRAVELWTGLRRVAALNREGPR